MSKSIQNLYSLLSGPYLVSDAFIDVYSQMLRDLINKNSKVGEIIIESNYNIASYDSSQSHSKRANVLEIKFHSPVVKYSQLCGPMGTQSIISLLEENKDNDKVDAVFFDVFSGGGQQAGTPEFAHYIHDYPKPIGIYTNDSIGSAAYYFSSGADFIIANKFAQNIGSIGSLSQYIKVKNENIEVKTIYADQSTEKNSIVRALDKGDDEPLRKELLNPITDSFIKDVEFFRPNIDKAVFKGKMYTPKEALKLGLIDGIGTKEEALDRLINLVHSENKSNNNTEMAKTNDFPLLAAALGAESITTSNGILGGRPTASFTMEDLKVIEKSLQASNDTKAMEDLKTQLQAEKDEKATIQMQLDGLANGIDKAVKTTGAKGTTPLNQLEAVNSIITEWAAKPGATHTAPETDGDREEAEEGYIDPNAGHNKILAQLKNQQNED